MTEEKPSERRFARWTAVKVISRGSGFLLRGRSDAGAFCWKNTEAAKDETPQERHNARCTPAGGFQRGRKGPPKGKGVAAAGDPHGDPTLESPRAAQGPWGGTAGGAGAVLGTAAAKQPPPATPGCPELPGPHISLLLGARRMNAEVPPQLTPTCNR